MHQPSHVITKQRHKLRVCPSCSRKFKDQNPVTLEPPQDDPDVLLVVEMINRVTVWGTGYLELTSFGGKPQLLVVVLKLKGCNPNS